MGQMNELVWSVDGLCRREKKEGTYDLLIRLSGGTERSDHGLRDANIISIALLSLGLVADSQRKDYSLPSYQLFVRRRETQIAGFS